jgi:inosose dehydratase
MPSDRSAIVARVEAHPETWWTDDDWRLVVETLGAIADLAAERGLVVAYHPHVGTHVESRREIDRLIGATDASTVKLCLDTGHILIGGTDPVDILNDAGERIVHVHAKDVDGAFLARLQRGEMSYDDGVRDGLYCDLGDGLVDWSGVAANLAAHGWVVAEQDRQLTIGDPAPVTSLRRNRAFLRRLLNA